MNSDTTKPPLTPAIPGKPAIWIAIVALAYFLAHQISFLFPDSARVLMAVWPAGGIGLAALLLMPRRQWPRIVIALFVAGNTANLVSGRPFVNSLGFMTANVLESLACAWCMESWCKKGITLCRVKDVLVLIFCATVINACTACIGAGTAAFTHTSSFWSFWETWWVSDGLGILLITPLILSWSTVTNPRRELRWSTTAEFLVFCTVWFCAATLAFNPHAVYRFIAPQPYILLAILAWASLRFGLRGVTVALVMLAVILVTSKSVVSGPLLYGGRTVSERMMMAQLYLAVVAATGVLLASMYAEAKAAESEARESERNYRDLFNNAEVGMFRTKLDGSAFVDFNDRFLTIFNCTREEMLRRSPSILWADPRERLEIMERLKTQGRVIDVESKMVDTRGTVKCCLTSVRLSRERDILEGSTVDVTELKRLEEERQKLDRQLNQTQKLESLGVLAGGIAHDFNNLLSGIFGYIDLAHEESRDSHVSNYLSKALSTIDRARGLTQQLLTFAKGGAPVKKAGALFPFVEETARFALSGSSISVRFDVRPDLWPCDFDTNQMGQVIDNMVINAKQAMPTGGTITISAANRDVKERDIARLNAGRYVEISIRDSGIGIPPEILPRIFDPFFTTKQKGSGLGLSTCFSIINRHEGCLTVESEPGDGTVFHIFLPASPGLAVEGPGAAARIVKGTGAILVMDDEEVVLEATTDILELLGYSVVAARNGAEALDAFGGRPKSFFRAVILDLTIPGGMGGKQTAAAIRRMDAHVPIFVSSGYADDPVMASPGAFGFTASIPKPYRMAELAHLLSENVKEGRLS